MNYYRRALAIIQFNEAVSIHVGRPYLIKYAGYFFSSLALREKDKIFFADGDKQLFISDTVMKVYDMPETEVFE